MWSAARPFMQCVAVRACTDNALRAAYPELSLQVTESCTPPHPTPTPAPTHRSYGSAPCCSSSVTAASEKARLPGCAATQAATCSGGDPSQATPGDAPPSNRARAAASWPAAAQRGLRSLMPEQQARRRLSAWRPCGNTASTAAECALLLRLLVLAAAQCTHATSRALRVAALAPRHHAAAPTEGPQRHTHRAVTQRAAACTFGSRVGRGWAAVGLPPQRRTAQGCRPANSEEVPAKEGEARV